jgi:large subunit ribosomal protein L21
VLYADTETATTISDLIHDRSRWKIRPPAKPIKAYGVRLVTWRIESTGRRHDDLHFGEIAFATCGVAKKDTFMPSFSFAPLIVGGIRTMYAIVKSGGKQYKAAKDDVLIVERIDGEPGQAVELGGVLLVVDGDKTTVGSPLVKGAKVTGEILRHAQGKKINGFNYKAKKNVRKRWGARPQQTYVRVTDVVAGS